MEKQGEKYDRYSYEELSAFCLQIALLLEAAVPLEEGLTIMAEDAAEEKKRPCFFIWQRAQNLEILSLRCWRIQACFPPISSVWPDWGSRQVRWIR